MRCLAALVFTLGLAVVGCSETTGTTGQEFPCTEQGIRDAIAEGGGPHTFACDGTQTVVPETFIVIDNDVILDGESELTIDGEGAADLVVVSEGVTAELRGVIVTGGGNAPCDTASDDCSGIANGGALSLTDVTLVGNGIGLLNGPETASVSAFGTTISGNEIGVWNLQGTIALANSTLSGNDGCSFDHCGLLNENGTATLTHCTVTGSDIEGDAITISRSVVFGVCAGPVTSGGYNVEGPGDTCGFDQITDGIEQTAEELKLGPLQDNGGPTMTHALLQGSNAIDGIPETDCATDFDQRGERRPAGDRAHCDKGAFEWQPLVDFCEPLTDYQPACYPVCESYAGQGGFIHNCIDVSVVAECYDGNDCATDTCEAEWAAWLDDCVGGP